MATGFVKGSVPGGKIQETVFAHRFAKHHPNPENIFEGLIPGNLNDKLTGCGSSPYMQERNLIIIATFKGWWFLVSGKNPLTEKVSRDTLLPE